MDWKEQLSSSVTDEEQRIFIKFCTLLGYSIQETKDLLAKAIGDKSISIESIEEIHKFLKNDHTPIEDSEPVKSPTLLQRVLSPIKSSGPSKNKKLLKKQDKYLNNFLYKDKISMPSSDALRKRLEKEYFPILSQALNSNPWLIREAAFEFMLINSYQTESSEQFWRYASEKIYKKLCLVFDVHRDFWKFLFLTHWLLRNGHPNCIKDAYGQRSLLIELSKVKKCLWPNCCPFSELNQLYCALLSQKIEFHMEHTKIPGNLVVNEKLLDDIGSEDIAIYKELCSDLFDYIDKILNFQSKLFKFSGSSPPKSPFSKCLLNPLKICIIESGQIYEIIFLIMHKLHNNFPSEELKTYRNRFEKQFKQLRLFFLKCQEFDHLKESIQIPELIEQPPDLTQSKNHPEVEN